jgi:hypothetical protein
MTKSFGVFQDEVHAGGREYSEPSRQTVGMSADLADLPILRIDIKLLSTCLSLRGTLIGFRCRTSYDEAPLRFMPTELNNKKVKKYI